MKVAFRPYTPPGQVAHPVKWEDIWANEYKGVRAITITHALEIIKNDAHVYDCDGGGTAEDYFAILDDEGKYHYFKMAQEFYWTDWDNENRHVENVFDIVEVTKDEAAIPAERDWMDITQKSYPEVKKWPPKDGLPTK